jgi:hypothetical protein
MKEGEQDRQQIGRHPGNSMDQQQHSGRMGRFRRRVRGILRCGFRKLLFWRGFLRISESHPIRLGFSQASARWRTTRQKSLPAKGFAVIAATACRSRSVPRMCFSMASVSR